MAGCYNQGGRFHLHFSDGKLPWLFILYMNPEDGLARACVIRLYFFFTWRESVDACMG